MSARKLTTEIQGERVKGHLGAQVGDQAVFRAGVKRHADEEDGILFINQHFAEPGSLVVVGGDWVHVSERRRREEEDPSEILFLGKPVSVPACLSSEEPSQQLGSKRAALLGVVTSPFTRSLQVDLVPGLEVVEADGLVVEGEELDAALVHGESERFWRLRRRSRKKRALELQLVNRGTHMAAVVSLSF